MFCGVKCQQDHRGSPIQHNPPSPDAAYPLNEPYLLTSLPLSEPSYHTCTKSQFLLHHDHPLTRFLYPRPPWTGGVRCRRRAYLIDRLCPDRVIVAGVMARTAAEESWIDCEFISVPPSWVLKDIDGRCILANHGKTPESGRIFGEIVDPGSCPWTDPPGVFG